MMTALLIAIILAFAGFLSATTVNEINRNERHVIKGGYFLTYRHFIYGNNEDTVGGKINAGSVTLYERYGQSIDYSKPIKITAPDAKTNDGFGSGSIIHRGK